MTSVFYRYNNRIRAAAAAERQVSPMNALTKQAASFSESMIPQCLENAAMDPTLFDTYGVKRGLRDKAGNGVVAGLTNISDVSA